MSRFNSRIGIDGQFRNWNWLFKKMELKLRNFELKWSFLQKIKSTNYFKIFTTLTLDFRGESPGCCLPPTTHRGAVWKDMELKYPEGGHCQSVLCPQWISRLPFFNNSLETAAIKKFGSLCMYISDTHRPWHPTWAFHQLNGLDTVGSTHNTVTPPHSIPLIYIQILLFRN